MICEKCDKLMKSMGYGDYICDECNIISYSESEEDFYNRIYKGENIGK